MKWNYSLAAAAVLAVLCVGCRSLPYFFRVDTVSQEQAAPPAEQLTADVAQASYLHQGRQIFVTNCTKCHAAMPIEDFTSSEWTDDILPTMSKKAKLNAEEKAALTEYVIAVASRSMADR